MAGKDEVGYANVVCFVAAAVMFLAGNLCALSNGFPWWSGQEPAEFINVSVDVPLDAVSSLWNFKLEVRKDLEDGVSEMETIESSWDDWCSAYETTAVGMSDTCLKIKLIRAFVFIGFGVGIIACLVLVFAGLKMPIMALAGAAVATLHTLIALAAAALAATMSSALTNGAIFVTASFMFGTLGAVTSLYGTSKAVKAEQEREPEEVFDNNRQERVSAAREQAAQKTAALMSQGTRPQGDEASHPPSSRGSDAGSEIKSQKKMKHLRSVLFWGQDADEGDEEEIPDELLQRAFWDIDKDETGSIDMEELVEALQLCGLPVSQTAMEQIMTEIDKNNDGEISLTEFVEFFRNIEELNQFQKKSAAKAQFASFLMNFCFLLFIIIVGVLLMMFIRMDEDADEDTRVIMQNGLIGCSLTLVFLFVCVVAMPAARLTLGPSIEAWQSQIRRLKFRSKKKPQEEPQRGPREVAWQPEVGPVAPEKMAQSYRRARKVQAMLEYSDQVAKDAANMPPEKPRSRKSTKASMAQSLTSSVSNTTLSSGRPGGMVTGAVPGAITSGNGTFERYNPDAYLYTEELMLESGMYNRTTNSFSPLQVSGDIHTAIRDAEVVNQAASRGGGGNLALTDGSAMY